MDDIRHGEPIEPQRYRVRPCDLTPQAAADLARARVRLDQMTFTDTEYYDLTGRWPWSRS
jgi:hypothetical protein